MKTKNDLKRFDKANELNDKLIDKGYYNFHVIPNGKKGPYTLIIDNLNYKELIKIINKLK